MVVTWLERDVRALLRSRTVQPTASVVIPAHNEQDTILRCLEALRPAIVSGELEVVVVANGCNDRTAEVARAFHRDVIVVDTEIGNKAHALNLGDEAATVFPRLYLDADVVLPAATALRIAKGLKEGKGEIAAPNLAVRLDGRSWAVRAYYRTWIQLPYVRNGVIGAGLYAVTEQGRQRWGQFPDLLGEDDFVRRQFSESDQVRMDNCTFVIDAPCTLRDLFNIRSRTDRGMIQLAKDHPTCADDRKGGYRSAILSLLRSPKQWLDVAAYLAIWGAAKLTAKWQFRFGRNKTVWTRDNSARQAVAATFRTPIEAQTAAA